MIRWTACRGPLRETPPVKSWRSWTGLPRTSRGSPVENAAPNNSHQSVSQGVPDPGWTLRRRLLVIITIALLPIVAVSLFQGVELVKRDTEDVRAQLIQSARTTAAGAQEVLN